jgi:hypothetical protein
VADKEEVMKQARKRLKDKLIELGSADVATPRLVDALVAELWRPYVQYEEAMNKETSSKRPRVSSIMVH